MNLVIKWFSSRTVRLALDLCKTVRKISRAQQDILKPDALDALRQACTDLRKTVDDGADTKAIKDEIGRFENIANKHLRPYPSPGMRENVEVILVAIAVAMGIRTFFLQPFKIPTGSMQPTLFGITHQSFRNQPEVVFPTGLSAWVDSWFRGISYYHVVAESSGSLDEVEPPKRVFPLVQKQRFRIGQTWYTVWFPPNDLFGGDYNRGGLFLGQSFEKDEEILKLKVITGDHLFVDRMTYNFRKPTRGEIIVFATEGVNGLPQDQFYIKRLVGLGGETVAIGNDRHTRINGERLDAATPRFEYVYTFSGPPDDSVFSGHVNEIVAVQYQRGGHRLAPLFRDESYRVTIRTNHYMVFGDNTLNSRDSRDWGDFTRTNVIGKSAFVYWPILGQKDRASRFGWSHR